MKNWLLLMSFFVSFAIHADDNNSYLPKAKAGTKCVEDRQIMRTNHMDLILHQRDKTMRDGKRDGRHSLKECINCHVTKNDKNEYPNIDSSQHFCNSCHTYVAVKTDCFSCHRSIPENKQVKK
ncbi:MAG: Hdr-like menaquinol oxidoreductase cytochrome c subunit [Gammaproteobacteria bacterium]|nr:MAG: Hdr-like menaquinol oxidoreductase cytochrome c subunit [Gammaproteobacteria bacterium]